MDTDSGRNADAPQKKLRRIYNIMKKLTDKQMLRRKKADQASLDEAGTQAALQIGHMVQKAAIAAKRTGRKGVEVLAPLRDDIATMFTKAMVASYVLGEVRIQENVKAQTGLTLDAKMDAVLRSLRARSAMTQRDWEDVERKFGTKIRELLDIFSQQTGEQIDDAINIAITEQRTARDGIRIMQEQLTGVSGVAKPAHIAESIYRTQTSIAYSAGQQAMLEDPALQEILWGFKYVTVGDNRVRDEHEAWEGVTLPKDDPFWITHTPPNGWNCRCDVIEIYDEREAKAPPETFVPTIGPNKGKEIVPIVAPGFEFRPGDILNMNVPGSA
jgi:SPP1 gp7 family putative phage head morphogenesis protein